MATITTAPLTPGRVYDLTTLTLIGWARHGVRLDTPPEGYQSEYYFREGEYLGADGDGIEPVFVAAIATYSVNTRDTNDRQAWMDCPAIVRYQPVTQDSGRCRFRVVTSDPATLEAALDADEDVLDYGRA
jgi:hypothetical protein